MYGHPQMHGQPLSAWSKCCINAWSIPNTKSRLSTLANTNALSNANILSNANALSHVNASSALSNTMHCQMQMYRQHY